MRFSQPVTKCLIGNEHEPTHSVHFVKASGKTHQVELLERLSDSIGGRDLFCSGNPLRSLHSQSWRGFAPACFGKEPRIGANKHNSNYRLKLRLSQEWKDAVLKFCSMASEPRSLLYCTCLSSRRLQDPLSQKPIRIKRVLTASIQ